MLTYFVIVGVLLFLSALLILWAHRNKSQKWTELLAFVLATVGMFVGVYSALYWDGYIEARKERQRAIRWIQQAKKEVSNYKVHASKWKQDLSAHNIGANYDVLEPVSLHRLLNSEDFLKRASVESIASLDEWCGHEAVIRDYVAHIGVSEKPTPIQDKLFMTYYEG